MPAISVIVPVYKVEPYLHRCVDSILEQTFTDFELILVDDGSPDNCPAICDEYACKDSRVHVIHQENGGLSAARNAGIDWAFANSDSQWLSFVDSDDWIHPEYLEQLLNAAMTNNVAVSICRYAETKGETPEVNPDELIPRIWVPEDFFIEHNVNATVAWGKLYRKECFQEIRYPVGKMHEDEYTTYRILFQYKDLAVLAAPLYFYFQNPNSFMNSGWSPKRLDVLNALDGQATFFKKHKNARAYISAVRSYIWSITRQQKYLQMASLPPQEAKKYDRFIKKQLRRSLCRNRKTLSFRENKYLYEMAYPKTMHFYWLVIAAILKMDRIVRR